jgi:hypothetical protein
MMSQPINPPLPCVAPRGACHPIESLERAGIDHPASRRARRAARQANDQET